MPTAASACPGRLQGAEFGAPDADGSPIVMNPTGPENYYEFLQISPKAEPATIQRVYRFLASRFHPDNPETGDPERFLELNRVFHILSDPHRRAAYDATLDAVAQQPMEAFEEIDFMDGIEGEVNRRLAVLAVLYRRCRANVENPRVSLAEMESLMGFPREYLDFTMWYLKNKKYIMREDNSDFSLTVQGVDYIEENYDKIPMFRRLLESGSIERHEDLQVQSKDVRR
jgi:curved DNA-binding protein CbpA